MDTEEQRPAGQPGYWILLVAVGLFVAVLCFMPTQANDLFWQLRTGRDIVSTGTLPHVDRYSWTRWDQPWVVHEWLSFVLFWLAYKYIGGFAGLLLLKIVVLCTALMTSFACLVRTSGGKLIPAFLLTMAAAMSVSVGFEARPQIFTYLLLTITSSIVLTGRNTCYINGTKWLLVPILLLWANLHSGVLIGLFLIMANAIGDLTDGYFRRGIPDEYKLKVRGRRLGLVALVCIPAMCVTPYGISEYTDFLNTVRNSNAVNSVSEWTSPTLHSALGLNFAVLSGVLVYGLIFSKRPVFTADIICTVALLHGALISTRNIPLFALAGVMIISPYLFSVFPSTGTDGSDNEIRRSSLFGRTPDIPAVFIAALGFLIIGVASSYSLLKRSVDWTDFSGRSQVNRLAEANVEIRTEPVRAAAFLNSGIFPATWKMYNYYDDGGYLIWALPRYPVSIDGRADVYFGNVFENYIKLHQLPYVWKSDFASFDPDFVLTSRIDPQSTLFMTSPDWALVYVDSPDLDRPDSPSREDNSFVFVRRNSANQPEIVRARALCPALLSPAFRAKYHAFPATN